MRNLAQLVLAIAFALPLAGQTQSGDLKSLLQASNAQHQNNISESKAEIARHQTKLAELKEELKLAKSELETARSDLRRAQSTYQTDASPENERNLKYHTGQEVLAERKVASRESRLEWLNEKLEELDASIASSTTAIARNNERLSTVTAEQERRRIARAREAEEQAKFEKMVASRKAAEAAKVASEGESQKQAEAARQRAAAELAKRRADAEGAEQRSNDAVKSELDQEEREYVKRRIDDFNEYLAGDVRRNAELRMLTAYSNQGDKIRMEHLGGEVYRGTGTLSGGELQVSLSNSYFKIFVPQQYDGKSYTLYFDNRDKYNRKLTSFRSELTEGLAQPQ